MNIIVSGGGTAGHINPALALATELQHRGHSVWFAGTPHGVESKLVPEAGIPFKAFEAEGFRRRHPQTLPHALSVLAASTKKAQKWFDEIHPDVVVCFGGYVCIPVGRAAEKHGIPVVVHEQNSIMGMANKYLSKKATRVALTYKVAGNAVRDQKKLVVTGNPVRASVFAATREEGRTYTNVPDDAILLTVFGGSLGAAHINKAFCEMANDLMERPNLYVRQITGPKQYDAVRAQLHLSKEKAQRWQIVSYEHKMGYVLAASDAVVSRAGATSLAEISALHIPAILVPYPYATANHQATNAREYVAAGAAWMEDDDNVETKDFSQKVAKLIDDDHVRATMRKNAESLKTRDAASKLADVVIEAARS